MGLNGVLVTGATGFVGRHLVAALAPEMDVTALVRSASAKAHVFDSEAVTVRAFSDEADIAQIFKEVAPATTIHLATHFPVRGHSSDFRPLIDANVTFGAVIASTAASVGSKFINTSSYWQHYNSEPYSPVSLYAASKEAFRALLQYYIELEGLEVVDVCLFDNYGQDDDRGKILQLLLNAAGSAEPLKMSHGTQLINLLDIIDVVSGIRQSLNAPAGNYELRSPDWLTIRDLANLVGDVVGESPNVMWGALPERPREMREPWIISPVVPDWVPTVDLRQGIQTMHASMIARTAHG